MGSFSPQAQPGTPFEGGLSPAARPHSTGPPSTPPSPSTGPVARLLTLTEINREMDESDNSIDVDMWPEGSPRMMTPQPIGVARGNNREAEMVRLRSAIANQVLFAQEVQLAAKRLLHRSTVMVECAAAIEREMEKLAEMERLGRP